MASGTIKGSFTGVSQDRAYPQIEWSSTKNVSANNSSITAILYFYRPSASQQSWNAYGNNMTITINGSGGTASRTFDLRNTSKQEIWRRTITVNHNADGKKTINISASGTTGVSLGNFNFSGSAKLDDIPRAYDYTVSPATANIGDTITITVKDNGSGFDPWLYFYYGSLNWSVGKIPVGTYKFKLDTAKLAPIYPNAASSWGRIEVQTWQGNNTKIGGYPTRLDLTLPESLAKPTVDSITPKETNAAVNTVIGSGTSYLQDKSLVQFTTKATAQYGATFATSQILYNGQALPNVNGIPTLDLSTIHVDAGEVALTASVKDSRGFSATKDFKITVLAYKPPAITTLAATRSTSTPTTVAISKKGTVSSIKISNVEKNTYTVKTEYKLATATSWTTFKTESNAIEATTDITGIDIAKSYDIRLTIADKFNSISSTLSVSTAKTLLSMYKDVGVGIGKIYEEGHGVLDVQGDIHLNGNIMGQNKISIPGGVQTFIDPKILANGIDLNTLTATGEYVCTTDAVAATLVNSPEKKSFHLRVVNAAGPHQFLSTYHPYTGATYVRKMYNNTWGVWLRTSNLNRQASLWTGNLYMRGSDIITPLKSLGQCANGWCLIWQRWNGTALVNSSITYSYVPKYAVSSGNWGFYHFAAPNNALTEALIPKYLYIQENGTKLQGLDDNATTANQRAVLVAVVEW